MKIAFIGQKGIPAKFGGVERYTEEVAVRMAKKGHDVFVYTRKNYTDPKLKEYRGTKLISLPSFNTKNLDAISHTFFATMHAIFQDYDVIHYHSIGPTSLSFLIRIFKPKAALISIFQCQDYAHKKWGWFAKGYLRFSEFLTCKVPNVTIVVSSILKKYAAEKYHRETVLIPNGTEIKQVEKTDYLQKWNLQKGGYIVCIGRLIRHKGVHYLIEAFKNLEDKHLTRGKKLVIVGDGFHTDDYVKELKDTARGRENIIFTGSRSGEELDQLFAHSYLFVQPSESEGLSMALLEAMGHSKAILSSDIKENMEPLNDETAVFFKSGDARDLEEKMVFLINNPVIARTMGEAAMQKARKEYSWDTIVSQIEKVYIDTLAKKHNPKTELHEENI
ncbi:MAG: glycosyltransferase family 4 protein [Parcubacteria group bacterium]